MQAERRRDPYPFTWEIPAGVTGVVVLLGILGVHLGRGLATMAAGGGWVWPASKNLFSSLFDVAAGDPLAGLTRAPAVLPAAAGVIGWVVVAELLLAAVVIAGLVWGLRRWGPGRMRGMASAADAERTLGVGRLRRVRRIIRPDLYPSRERRGAVHDHHHT